VRAKKKGGRNNQGKVTTRFRGGGHKQMYRLIDFKRKRDDEQAKVISIEYDPNRTCRIALIEYPNADRTYILAPLGLKAGDVVESGRKLEPKLGNCMPLSSMPAGVQIHNIEMQPGKGGQMVRTAGGVANLDATEGQWAQVTLPSGEIRRIPAECRATIGMLSNTDHMNVTIGKAGRNRWKGRKPHVRGICQNPVAHPMGGGEGRTSGGRHPCSPTGVLSKGGKTRNPRKASSKAIIRRRKSRRYGQLKV
jgi:large subunit ribosomal protein L2